MKRILYLLISTLLFSCTYNSPPEELAPFYMYKFSEEGGWTASRDFLKTDIDGYNLEVDYVPTVINNLFLSNSYIQDTYRGNKNTSVFYKVLPTQIKGELLPNAPFKIGDDWDFNDSTNLPITEVYMNGFLVTIALPKSFEEHLLLGFYRLLTYRQTAGVSLANQWTIKSIDKFGDEIYHIYHIEMQPIGKRKVEIIGIDTSNSNEIRLTVAFEGQFKAVDSFEQKLGRNSQIYERGSFSFVINQ